MASPERKVIYRQGFRSLEPVTDILNSFVKTPRGSFTLFSKAEFTHPLMNAIEYDDQTNEARAEKIQEINDKVTSLGSYSRNLAIKTIHLALPAGGTQDSRGLLLRFSPLPQEAATYWKIVQDLKNEDEHPSPSEIVKLTQQDLYIGIPTKELRSPASLKLAKQTLAYALRDPSQKYSLGVENIPGLTKSEVTVNVATYEQPPDHPDVINEDKDAV